MWRTTSRGELLIQIRINRSTLVAVVVSVLVHVLALYLWSIKPKQVAPVDARQQPMEVSLALPVLHPPKAAPAIEPPKPEPTPIPKPKVRPAKVTPSPVRPAPVPQVPLPAKPVAPVLPTTAPSPITTPPTDMMSYVNANRERRRQAEESAARQNAAASSSERGTSDDDARSANIRRNLQMPGTNGVFQILSMDNRSATFSFHGWRNELSYSRREEYQVEVGMNGDLRREVIRKMIEIIRRYYNGDFNWDSYRLQRVVVLSARPEDTAGLEDFMLQEFFGSGR
jgi:type IV secretory pathway VirB10-like protein